MLEVVLHKLFMFWYLFEALWTNKKEKWNAWTLDGIPCSFMEYQQARLIPKGSMKYLGASLSWKLLSSMGKHAEITTAFRRYHIIIYSSLSESVFDCTLTGYSSKTNKFGNGKAILNVNCNWGWASWTSLFQDLIQIWLSLSVLVAPQLPFDSLADLICSVRSGKTL